LRGFRYLNLDEQNEKLIWYGLEPYKYRWFFRLMAFCHKIMSGKILHRFLSNLEQSKFKYALEAIVIVAPITAIRYQNLVLKQMLKDSQFFYQNA
jgi:hypothetical protein